MDYIAPNFSGKKYLSILEPSVGDGSFIKSFNRTTFPDSIKHFSFQAVEKVTAELRLAEIQANTQRKKNTKFSFIRSDFLKYQSSVNRRFGFIVGNPPYIRKSLLKKVQVEQCKSIHDRAGLSDASVKNIWSSFIIACSNLLTDDGILSFVLPSELLQVTFSESLRTYLLFHFECIEIFTFDELMFEQIGQDTVILTCYKKSIRKGQFYAHISDRKQLINRSFLLGSNEPLVKSEIKWTHHFLLSEEIELLVKLRTKLPRITEYCKSKPGIVTAANKYFIVNENTEKTFNLSQFTRPIIQKGLFVNGSVVFDGDALAELLNDGRPTKLICFPARTESSFDSQVRLYLKQGKSELIHERYKCSKRSKWFVVPNIEEPPQGFFFKRCHFYPKLLKNEANVLVTDSGYKIEMLNREKIENLIFSFYNSLTLAFAELEGRYYGGGVLELTPKEFKKLPIPFLKINDVSFKKFRGIFEKKSSIDDVLNQYDAFILNTSLGLSNEEIEKIKSIMHKLVAKRFRNTLKKM